MCMRATKLVALFSSQHNETIATVDLVACEDVAAPNPLEAAGIWVGRLLSHFTGSQTVATSR